MCADIYTKAISNREVWNRLRMLINIFTKEEIDNGEFSPDVMDMALDRPKPFAGLLDQSLVKNFDGDYSLNMHFYAIIQGESTRYTDFWKPVKQKIRKPKPKLKPIPRAAAVCSINGIAPANELMYRNCGLIQERDPVDTTNHFLETCVDRHRAGNDVFVAPGRSGLHDLVLGIDWKKSDYKPWTVIQLCASENSYIALCNPFRG